MGEEGTWRYGLAHNRLNADDSPQGKRRMHINAANARPTTVAAAIGLALVLAGCGAQDGTREAEDREPDSALAAGTERRSGSAYTEVQAERGKVVYQAYCAFCHLEDLSGFRGLPLVGPTFIANWSASNATLENLFSFVTTSMPEDQPGVLQTREYIDVVAYILQQNGYPAGDRELIAEPSVLGAIRIELQSSPNQ